MPHPSLLLLPCSSLLWHLTTVVILGSCRAFPMYCEFLRLGNLFVFTMIIHQQHAWYIVGTRMFTEWLKEGLPLYSFLFQSSVNLRKQTLFSVQHSSAFQQRQYWVTAGCVVAIVFVYLGHTRIIHYWFLMSCDMHCLRKVAYKNQVFSILLQHSISCKKNHKQPPLKATFPQGNLANNDSIATGKHYLVLWALLSFLQAAILC